MKNTTIALALLLAGFLGLACGQNQLDSPASTGGSPASTGVPSSGGSGGVVFGSGTSAPVGGGATGGMSGTGGTACPWGCPADDLLCPSGTVGHDVCGCAICAQADAGVTKDGARDVVCGPMCNVYCPYGNKVDDNGCTLCACNPAPSSDDGASDAGCPPIACPAIACVAGMVTNPDDPCACPVCQVVCSCPFVPATCPYGYQTGPAPCGCPSCAPAPSNLDAGRCSWPANLTPSGDESAVGCWAYAVTGKADGGTFACSSSEYSLDCVGAMSSSSMSIPAPDSSLGCRILPIPTPPNRLYYCCPCDGATVAP